VSAAKPNHQFYDPQPAEVYIYIYIYINIYTSSRKNVGSIQHTAAFVMHAAKLSKSAYVVKITRIRIPKTIKIMIKNYIDHKQRQFENYGFFIMIPSILRNRIIMPNI
jgi:hypothetical protein